MGRSQSRPALSQETTLDSRRVPIVTPIHILLVEVTHTREQATLIQEDTRNKTNQIQEPEGIQTNLQVDTQQLEDILTKTQPGEIIQISTQLVEATQQQVVIPTNIQAEPTPEDILTSTLLGEVIQTRVQEETILISIQVPEATQLPEATLLPGVTQLPGATQQQVATPTNIQAGEGTLTSIQQEVATQSEVEIQDRVGVILLRIQGVTPVEQLAVTPTGTQIIRSSVHVTAEEAMDMVVMGWQDHPSLVLCRAWDTSPSPQVLPKKPCWQQASVLWREWLLDMD